MEVTGTGLTSGPVLQLRVAGARGQPPLIYWALVPRGPSCYMTSNSLSKSSPRTNVSLNEVPSLGASGVVSLLYRCVRLGPVEPTSCGQALWLPAWLAATRRDALIEALHASSSIGQRTKLAGCPGRDISNGATRWNNQPSMERQQMAPSAPWSAKRPPAAMPAPVALRRRRRRARPDDDAPATRPATANRDAPSTRHPGLDGERQCATSAAVRGQRRPRLRAALGLASTAAVGAGWKFSPAFAKATSPSARASRSRSARRSSHFSSG